MLKKENIKLLTKGSMLAALYIVTTAVNPFGYGMIQLRLSAIISMLPFFRKEYRIPCIAAVAIANIFSPFGIIDVAAGIMDISLLHNRQAGRYSGYMFYDSNT